MAIRAILQTQPTIKPLTTVRHTMMQVPVPVRTIATLEVSVLTMEDLMEADTVAEDTTDSFDMRVARIISRQEALQILKNDLRRAALEKHAAELANATPEKRADVLAQIDREIQKELSRFGWGNVLY